MDRLAELEATRDQDREEPATKQALALSRFTGIGPTSAHVLGGEVFHREFGNRRELAASFGLAPSTTVAARFTAIRGLPNPATLGRAGWRSRWLGCGCASSQAAR